MVFEHYKGNRYKFVGLAMSEHTLDAMVLYSPVTDLSVVWARLASEFFGVVNVPKPGVMGHVSVPRFRPIPPGE